MVTFTEYVLRKIPKKWLMMSVHRLMLMDVSPYMGDYRQTEFIAIGHELAKK